MDQSLSAERLIMTFTLLDSISTPGNPAKANDDAWMAGSQLAAVIDGATSLNDPIMPGTSDAAWLAHLAAERFVVHARASSARLALQAVVADLEDAFVAQRSRSPIAMHETPCASLMLIAPADGAQIDALWFGDCSVIVRHSDGGVDVIGDALDKRAAEASQVARLAAQAGVDPASTANRAEFLPSLRASRNRYNHGAGPWVLAPDRGCAPHAQAATFAVEEGAILLIASDGFTALVTDYGAYDAAGLVDAAMVKGLAALIDELRAIESRDPTGTQFARYKRSDDATAILVQILP
jgi:serine/threonine protein phosphatase PrpC